MLIIQVILYLGVGLSFYILARLILMRKFDFIHMSMIVNYCIEVIFGIIMIFYFFNVGALNFNPEIPHSNQDIDYQCKNYVTAWMVFWIYVVAFNFGLIFCRYLYVRKWPLHILHHKKHFNKITNSNTTYFINIRKTSRPRSNFSRSKFINL